MKDDLQTGVAPLIMCLDIWSDDFDNNHTRNNKNSTWLMTVTVCPKPNQHTSEKHTCAIALGQKGQDHQPAIEHFNKELQELSSISHRCSHRYNKNIPVAVRVLTMLADRPERCCTNCVLSHNGIPTGRWLMSACVDITKMPSCNSCFKKWLNCFFGLGKIAKTSICNKCGDWNYDSGSNANKHAKPEDCPKTKHADSPLHHRSEMSIPIAPRWFLPNNLIVGWNREWNFVFSMFLKATGALVLLTVASIRWESTANLVMEVQLT